MSHEALGIRQAMQAQLDISSAAAARVAKIRHPDVAPSVDGEAMAIRSALSAQKRSQYVRQLHTSNIDAEALHIKGAMDAQRLQRRYQRKLDKHHFPPHIVSTVHPESQPCMQRTHAQTHASKHTHTYTSQMLTCCGGKSSSSRMSLTASWKPERSQTELVDIFFFFLCAIALSLIADDRT